MSQTDKYGLVWTQDDLAQLAADTEKIHGIPSGGLQALLQRESNWNINATSPAGAQGIAQFMPPTSAEWEIDPWDPIDAISGAARYLKWLRSELPTWQASLAAYNYGIGRVRKVLGEDGYVPLTALPLETKNYVLALAPAFGDQTEGETARKALLPVLIGGVAFLLWRAA